MNLLEGMCLRAWLEHYSVHEIDWEAPTNKAFLSQFTGAILLLIPEAYAFLAENKLQEDDVMILQAMAAIGATLKELAEFRLHDGRRPVLKYRQRN